MKKMILIFVLLSFAAGCSDDGTSNNSNTNNVNNTTAEICDDTLDNDGDGDIDCDDSDCAAVASCSANNINNVTAEICDDTLDNDGDGSTDCDDTDCAAAANCSTNNVSNGACDNAADLAIIENPAVDQDAITGTCTQSCFFNGDFLTCVTECVQTDSGLSAGCSACYGGTADCGKTNCMTACMGGASPECEACLNENCHPAFVTCSGIEGQ